MGTEEVCPVGRCVDDEGNEIDAFHDIPVLASLFAPPSLGSASDVIVPFQGKVVQVIVDSPNHLRTLDAFEVTLDKNGARVEPTSLSIVSATQERLILDIGFPRTSTADRIVVTIQTFPVCSLDSCSLVPLFLLCHVFPGHEQE
jgi:hypothetical protein